MHVYYMNVCVGTYIWVNMCVYGYLCMYVYYMNLYVGTYIWINMCVFFIYVGMFGMISTRKVLVSTR